MKKILSLIMIVAMLATASLSFASCSLFQKEYVAVDASDLLKEDFGIAVKKGSTEMLNAVNAVINTWVANGTMQKYIDYYDAYAQYLEDPENKTAPEANGLKLTWDFGNATEEITVYTESGFAPFEFIDGNAIVGVDIAIMNEVAVNLGKKIKVVDMDFNAIPLQVKNSDGNAVGAAGLTINDERKDSVDFSSVYYSSTLVVVSAKDKSYDSVADLAGLKVGVQEGTSGDLILGKAKTADGHTYENEDGETVKVTVSAETTVQSYKQYSLAFADLKAGRIDAILMDKLPALVMLEIMK